MISLTYKCVCGFKTGMLELAQNHANESRHDVAVLGNLSPNAPKKVSGYDATEAAKAKATALEIMRQAKSRGLTR